MDDLDKMLDEEPNLDLEDPTMNPDAPSKGVVGDIQQAQTADINQLGRLGGLQQAQAQAQLDAQRQAAQMAVDDPRRRLSMLGAGITQLVPGAGAVTLAPETVAPQASPLTTALGLGLAGADIYGRIFGPRKS